MKDYKETLNLPKTDFPMRANLPDREPEVLIRWKQLNLYSKIQEAKHGCPRFILHDGPPYANARPHLGTALNKILKDTVIKSRLFSGYDAPYVPGWDCHGLPIELNVEKKVGKAGEKLTTKEFRKLCREYAASQVELQREDFQRLGVLGDWDHPYLTMDYAYEADTIRALARIIANGHLHRGKKPVHWCIACGSALAEAEVEYREKTSPAIDVSFEVQNPKEVFKRFNLQGNDARVIVPIWTTTPWTLPANYAVAVHPKLHYACVEVRWHGAPAYFILAKELLDSSLQRYGINDYAVHGNVTGAALKGILLRHPFLDRTVPIVLGEHVTTDAGTGNVHTAPAHGLEDYAIAEKYNLPLESPVDSRSVFIEDTPIVGGLSVFKANETIILALADRGNLIHSAVIQHSYPHCWRHKTALIFRATPQWFIAMDQNHLRKMALKSIEQTRWIPQAGATRIHALIVERPDWCISRQRSWGIPITLFVHKKTGELHPRMIEIMESIAQLVEKESVDAWFDKGAYEFLGDEAVHYEKVTDILDVWFESGVTHFCVLAKRPELGVPADLYFEGTDQHRGWFQSSLLTSLAIRNAAPFKSVLTHGYVVDGEGRKMSKSIGNVILPSDITQQMGADILRLWAASVDHTVEINASLEILKRVAEAYRRIRNTARFFISNLYDFDPLKDAVAFQQLLSLDRWALATAVELQEKIVTAYENYRFPLIYQAIHNFCTVEMGSFYLDIIKDRLYTSKKTGLPRRSAQTVLYHLSEAFSRWIAPILSFTAEEIWQYLPEKKDRSKSVFLTEWYKKFPSVALTEHESLQWEFLDRLRCEVNKVLETFRNEAKIGSALEADVTVYVDKNHYGLIAPLNHELRFIFITSEAKVLPYEEKSGAAIETGLSGVAVVVEVSAAKKCVRCWQRRADVGKCNEHPDLCGRCETNVFGSGEMRQYA